MDNQTVWPNDVKRMLRALRADLEHAGDADKALAVHYAQRYIGQLETRLHETKLPILLAKGRITEDHTCQPLLDSAYRLCKELWPVAPDELLSNELPRIASADVSLMDNG